MKRHFVKRNPDESAPISLQPLKKSRKRGARIDLNGQNPPELASEPTGEEKAPYSVEHTESSFLSKLRQSKGEKPSQGPGKPLSTAVPKNSNSANVLAAPPLYLSAPIVPKQLTFNEPGKYLRLAARDRLMASLSKDIRALLVIKSPPAIEWWDQDVEVSEHIQHPKIIASEQLATAVYLTKDELRRKRRKERELKFAEARDRVKRGIDPPPPNKLKRSNVVAVVGGDYFKDPTKYDQVAACAEKERREAHLQVNQERHEHSQASKHERAKKALEKHREQLICKCFRVQGGLLDGKQKFLVDYTAKKYEFSGCCLQTTQCTLILVEGGEKEVQKYTKLMNKINWSYALIWEGPVKVRKFKKWSIHEMSTQEAERFMSRFGCDVIWNLVSEVSPN